jgi:hypothetical protein
MNEHRLLLQEFYDMLCIPMSIGDKVLDEGWIKGQYISNKTKGEKEDKGRAFLSYSKQDLQPVGEQKGTLPDVQSTLPGAK